MQKTILITGATDGIGLETAKLLVTAGHNVLIHGRTPSKLKAVEELLSSIGGAGKIHSYTSDLSYIADVEALAVAISAEHSHLDVIINNAGVYTTPTTRTKDNLDVRFVVNTLSPYLLTQKLIHLLDSSGRVVNLSSAAQSPVDISALLGQKALSDNAAYAQSKLAITMWSRHMADELGTNGPAVIAVNPASFLGSKMVKEAYGVAGNDLSIGADILFRAALSDEFANASGRYYDNDSKQFSAPHPDAENTSKNKELVQVIEKILTEKAI
ncbi:SDR family NAD(P)-dependent oxidoreductase [Vibrio hannami]|uniref:SDR family NAD(P)-dependent oxidoreductase n=1 Tax=Vibrio hannami TaxID=2717094 RepID=UPI00240FF09B|nr:SDR family NAD(P)-dependent oxidoreductase [Vibrio hannami]MDG3085875.1 SDR family NAD(P)-dependent oxidoreductase [Vibrio hannami]